MTQPIMAQAFYCQLKHKLRHDGFDWSTYADNKGWTTAIIEAIRDTCTEFTGYVWQREYLNLDVVAYDRVDDGPNYENNWRLRIAVEHEHSSTGWSYELCKLTDIVADLRVLMTYADLNKVDARSTLQTAVDRLGDHVDRVPDCQWLFVFAPLRCSKDRPFQAFTLTQRNAVTPLPDEHPLFLPAAVDQAQASSAVES